MTENQTGGVRAAAGNEVSEVARHAEEAAGRVGGTVSDQAARVTHETADQARRIVGDVRERVAAEAEQQATRVSKQLGRIADELGGMAGNAPPDSLSAGAIQGVADTSRQAARFLDERGAQGLLDSARDYARRKPGTFLLGAAVAGFLVGRVAKSVTGGNQGEQRPQGGGGVVPVAAERPDPAPDRGADYATGPGYGAPLTPSATPAVPPAGVPHVEP
ncbi:hypothetical protein [Lentzea sp. NPDC060358]|uniref:hypothetical protein n=1 Tax=Lentzea sp. NPDC060358 TaxID=3347103 RepID=UPI0036632156